MGNDSKILSLCERTSEDLLSIQDMANGWGIDIDAKLFRTMAVAAVGADDCVHTAVDDGPRRFQLLGAIEYLKHRLLSFIDDES